SDRTVRYLASGRPAIVQDTGIGSAVPVGDGLLVFSEAGEAAAALNEVTNNWAHHSQAARDLAVDHFSAEAVLPPLLAACGVTHEAETSSSRRRTASRTRASASASMSSNLSTAIG